MLEFPMAGTAQIFAVENDRIGRLTPMGATVVDGGVTFRTWAPNARDVFLIRDPQILEAAPADWMPDPADRLISVGDGTWAGFAPGMGEGSPYLFWINGTGSSGLKRDPYARELGRNFPHCPCLVRDPRRYPWHDQDWRRPAFRDLIIYQLHIGTFWAVDAAGRDRRLQYGRFLDVVEKIPYLSDLGVTAIQPLPIQEYDGDFGLGYAGLDYFSPEMTYQVHDPTELARHVAIVNALLQARGAAQVTVEDLVPGPNQLKCLVDLCHLHGIAVLFDLVYNHAGGGFDDRSLAYYDREPSTDDWSRDKHSLFFGNGGWAGGLVFDYANDGVRRFLINNACFFLDEYRIDGIRYDEISVASNFGGDRFCRDLSAAVRTNRPEVIQIAEYWNWDRARAVSPAPDGLGFDAALADGLRDALRAVLAQVSGGRDEAVDLDRLAAALYPPPAFPNAWRADQCLENHDVVRWDYGANAPRAPRVARLADPSNARSWYARSRARVATALLLTAPGIPMLFMGEEFLEDKPWHDDVVHWGQFLIWWDGLGIDREMRDFLRFTADLIHLRRAYPALRGEGIRVPQVHNVDRIIVMHRWVEGEGRDAVVVASFNEATLRDYPIELPRAGSWNEAFNSDFYDHFPNPSVVGNGGHVDAAEGRGRVYPAIARLTIPANGAIVLVRQS
jgi:1,4-alpha-glucan branching enzyme